MPIRKAGLFTMGLFFLLLSRDTCVSYSRRLALAKSGPHSDEGELPKKEADDLSLAVQRLTATRLPSFLQRRRLVSPWHVSSAPREGNSSYYHPPPAHPPPAATIKIATFPPVPRHPLGLVLLAQNNKQTNFA
jgi:hypothetical protein